MIPDPFARTVVLPVRVIAGVVEFYYGGALPALKDGTIGDLVEPSSALQNWEILAPLSNSLDVPILAKGIHLLAGIRGRAETLSLSDEYRPASLPLGFAGYAVIVLQESLELRFRGTKRRPCPAPPPRRRKLGPPNWSYPAARVPRRLLLEQEESLPARTGGGGPCP